MHLLQKSLSPFSPQPSLDHSRDQGSPDQPAGLTSSSPGEEANGEGRTGPCGEVEVEGGPAASGRMGMPAGEGKLVRCVCVRGRACVTHHSCFWFCRFPFGQQGPSMTSSGPGGLDREQLLKQEQPS